MSVVRPNDGDADHDAHLQGRGRGDAGGLHRGATTAADGCTPPCDAATLARCRAVPELNEDGLAGRGRRATSAMPRRRDRAYSVADERELTLRRLPRLPRPAEGIAGAGASKRCAAHGVAVKVLTGDNELVARKVCARSGPGRRVRSCSAREIEPMDDDGAGASSPKSTTRLRQAHRRCRRRGSCVRCKRSGHMVGFLGDGINDAPALRAADVGISVDTAVDIAKEAADIILLEKSLMVLERGRDRGPARPSATSIKYIKMTASSNFGNVFAVLVASALLPFLPMLPMQLLVQNLLYDISQIGDPVRTTWTRSICEKPRKWRPGDIGRFMVFIGPISSIFDITTFALMWYVFAANTPAGRRCSSPAGSSWACCRRR